MNIKGKEYRSIWISENDKKVVETIDQSKLPHEFAITKITRVDEMINAIKNMTLRGAGLIGAAAGYGMYLATIEAPENDFNTFIIHAANKLKQSRPTAVNLSWAVDRQLQAIHQQNTISEKIKIAFETANQIADEDVACCKMIGQHGLKLIKKISKKKNGAPVNILTHCNAGWLAFVDRGTATAPIYAAHDTGIKVHVWVDETRPRNQGAKLTAWELMQHGIPHHVIADNTGGHLMQHDMVDICIVGSDRTTFTGDVANKIGTYLKALAAKANNIPFYVALPSSSFDWNIRDGVNEIPIEERNAEEVIYTEVWKNGQLEKIQNTPEGSAAANYGFDVTPAKYITGLITERGICKANEKDILNLFPEHK